MYFTKERVEITKRIEKGLTKLFIGMSVEVRNEAENHAKDIGSYTYEAYTDNEVGRRVVIGFAVPR